LQIGQPNLHLRPNGHSFWFGTALIVVGVIVNVLSAWSHIRLVRDLKRGESKFARPSSLAITVAVMPAGLGRAMAIYLVSVREPLSGQLWIVTIPSHQSLDQTVQKLEGILQGKGVKLFAVMDHSGEAEKAGMQLRPTSS
jgi:hypothetical protein